MDFVLFEPLQMFKKKKSGRWWAATSSYAVSTPKKTLST